MTKKKFLWLLPLVALVIATSCGKKDSSKDQQEDDRVKVKVTTVKEQTIPQLATFTANVEGEVVNQITPAIPMRIKKIFVDVGASVSRGQKLVEMDNTNLQQQQIQLENLERDYKRYEELLAVGGVSQQQVDQMKVQLDVSRSAISNMRENTSLLSPINGIITARNYDDGDVFGVQPILTVQQLNPVKAVINVSESFFPKVKQGMPVEVRLDVYGDELFQGKVKLIHPTIDPNTHTFVCEIEISNPNLKVRPGMFSRVTMNFGTEDRPVVPDVAIIKQVGANDRFVFTVVDGVANNKKIELGQRLNDEYEVLSGLNSGEVVVTAGQTRLINGTKVQIVTE